MTTEDVRNLSDVEFHRACQRLASREAAARQIRQQQADEEAFLARVRATGFTPAQPPTDPPPTYQYSPYTESWLRRTFTDHAKWFLSRQGFKQEKV